ncbi:Asp-tRNA(Asn)/Glu-tRNA(Gln) amidotransferase subunit GatB [Brevibacillus laterosporus]|uniref:Asp-tRNA(Asn)/Glu-tRNA(Gln) amidotransferase subunit GatB n=1 Tax=Brevibacillus TaxID=55080 RepID=UPI0007C9323C|nr:Asp-tRNA(Asn)/Glu-tRNA(Gln) amidotransferase subunit GatB [Brevibacillus sp. SKDU10]OAJ74976.1 glutamyl-tRNA amidotransferase [Brevibacillus sp. SKDU10]
MSQKFETVIGLEVHAELSTNSKIFCGCKTEFGAPPNTHTCPICLGHPGVLPVLNQQALEFAIKASLAINCEISRDTKFDRKNYFYPDLPKAYQISQFDQPVGKNGWIDIEVNGKTKRIRINRLHLEEDAGKLTHCEYGSGTMMDYNRVGVPLVEIVTEPDISSPEEAKAYLEKLKAIIQYTEVSDVKMEQGSLRCDANVSIRPVGETKLGTKTELKNMNSFRNVQAALEYEVKRQEEVIESGGEIKQVTLRWDDANKKTIVMRSKEEAHDYRYFPDPDLVNVTITDEWIDRIKASIPELPDARQARYVEQYGLPASDAEVITMTRDSADFFDAAVATGADPKTVANFLMVDLFGYLNANNLEFSDVKMTPEGLGEMVKLIEKGTISIKIAKTVFTEMLETGKDPATIVEEKGLVQISDEGELKRIVDEIIAANQQSVEDYKAGKKQAIGFLVGQVMKQTKGKANPGVVNKLLVESLEAL